MINRCYAYHDVQVDHSNRGFAGRCDRSARFRLDVFGNQSSDEHADGHESGTTSEKTTATKTFSENEDEECACNNLDGTEESSEEEITIALAADKKLEVLRTKHGKSTTTGGVLEDE